MSLVTSWFILSVTNGPIFILKNKTFKYQSICIDSNGLFRTHFPHKKPFPLKDVGYNF